MAPMGKIQSGRLPLWLRLTVQFAFFGLMIAYITFILITMSGSRKLVSFYHEQIESFLESRGSLEELIQDLESGGSSGKGRRFLPPLPEELALGHKALTIRLFQRDEGGWNQIAGPPLPPPVPGMAPDHLETTLERALEQDRLQELGFFFGREDAFAFFINLTGKLGDAPTIIQFAGSRSGLSTLLSGFFEEFLLFSGTILLLSLVLSQLFVRKIVQPLRWLSREARLVAAGKRNSRFGIRGRDEIARLSQAIDTMTDNLSEQLTRVQRQADTLETMNRIDKAVLSSVSRKDLLGRVTDIVSALFPENGLFLFLRNREGEGADLLYHRRGGYNEEGKERPIISTREMPPDLQKNMEKPQLIQVDRIGIRDELKKELLPGSRWIYNTPIQVSEQYYGSLIISSDLEDPFSEDDRGSIDKLSDQIGVALQSLIQVEEREKLLLGSLMSLSAAIDAKSAWTAGHSERVRDLSLLLGEQLGLTEEELQELSISALLHDIGKLAISEAILDKPGRLTDQEYEIIKTHPRRGADIFGHLPGFPGVLGGILHHHERWDGQGYPGAISGETIPLNARIICIADVWDAITADRPYRKGMEREEALAFFDKQRGVMFEPGLTDLFLSLITSRI